MKAEKHHGNALPPSSLLVHPHQHSLYICTSIRERGAKGTTGGGSTQRVLKMGFSESVSRCRKHPRQQSPGVCSSCLREKLSQLSSSTSTNNTTNSCSSSSSISSCSSLSDSSYSSPSHHLTSDANGRMPFFTGAHDGFFARCRTVAFSAPLRPVNGTTLTVERKKKGGFWSRLLRPNSKRRKEAFLHSQTMKEIPSNLVNARS